MAFAGRLGAGCALGVALILGAGGGCGTSDGTAPPAGGSMALPSAPVALAVPGPARDWRWPARVAGEGGVAGQGEVAQALRRADEGSGRPLELVIDPALLGAGGLEASSMVRTLQESSGRRVVAATPTVDPFVRPWPLERGAAPRLRPDATLPAAARVWLLPAEVDPRRWRARPAVVRGSCAPLLAPLGQAQAFALARLEPFLVRVDERLARSFRRELGRDATALDARLRDETRAAEQRDDPGCAEHRAEQRGALRACLAGDDCTLAPRVLLGGSFVLGSPENALWSEGPCAEASSGEAVDAGGVPGAEIEAAARGAAAEVAARLEADWAIFADRVAGLGSIYDALDRACEARRRRFDPASEVELREGVRALFDGLRDPLVAAEGRGWRVDERSWPVPGRPEALRGWQVLETASGAELRAAALALEEGVYARARCGGPFDADPVAVVVSEGGRVLASTLAYPEELGCAEIPGGLGPPGP